MDMTIKTLDRLGKATSTRIPVIAAVSNPQVQACVDAIDEVILGAACSGVKVESTVVATGSATPPADENANRGNKWLMRFQDGTNGKIFTYELGTADNDQLPTPNSDFLDLTADAGLALKTALDAVYESPYGNVGVLLTVQQVNRATAGQ